MAAGRNSHQEERGGGAGGGGKESVGVALIRYCGRDLFEGCQFVRLFCLVVPNSNFARTNRGLLAATTGDKEKKKKKKLTEGIHLLWRAVYISRNSVFLSCGFFPCWVVSIPGSKNFLHDRTTCLRRMKWCCCKRSSG